MDSFSGNVLIKGATDLGVDLGITEANAFASYLDFLLEHNQRTNLTAIRDTHGVVVKHFLDSLAVVPFLPEGSGLAVLDIGSGAGFPGIPIKIAIPSISLTLLDSAQKKVAFLNSVVKHLNLDGVTVLCGRSEELAQQVDFREKFDIVVSRAVAELSVLSELCLPFVRVGGFFIAYKGLKAEEEIKKAQTALELLGGQITRNIHVVLPGVDDKRTLIMVEKLRDTPPKYPRRPGIPEKKPLT